MKGCRPIVHGGGRGARFVLLPALALAATMVGIAGCGSQGTQQASSSAAPSASASAPAVVILQPDYCKRVCERATSCGNEAALRTANLEPEGKAAIDKGAADATRTCIDTCGAEPATPVRLQLADRCNLEQDCDAFAKCLAALANELKK